VVLWKWKGQTHRLGFTLQSCVFNRIPGVFSDLISTVLLVSKVLELQKSLCHFHLERSIFARASYFIASSSLSNFQQTLCKAEFDCEIPKETHRQDLNKLVTYPVFIACCLDVAINVQKAIIVPKANAMRSNISNVP